jgi:hypothetical protein
MARPVARWPGARVQRASSGLADVVELILDKGLAIDAFAGDSLIRLEILGPEERPAETTADTYLAFAAAINAVAAAGDAGNGARVAPTGTSAVTQVHAGADTAVGPGGVDGRPRAGTEGRQRVGAGPRPRAGAGRQQRFDIDRREAERS